MRFESTVAFKYLIPRWKQLSVSIISLVSVLVISFVVWLVIVFLSVINNLEQRWTQQLVALAAPIRVTPTEAYYQSYYYQIDGLSLAASYTPKTIGEKLLTTQSETYDPTMDSELPLSFPPPDLNSDGSLRDLVKESWEALRSIPHVRPQEYEASFGTLHLDIRDENAEPNRTTFITQASYVVSHDAQSPELKKMLLAPTVADWNHLLHRTAEYVATSPNPPTPSLFTRFFDQVTVSRLETDEGGFLLSPALFPEQGRWKGVGFVLHNEIRKVIVPRLAQKCRELETRLQSSGYTTALVDIIFDHEQMHVMSHHQVSPHVQLWLDGGIAFDAELIKNSVAQATTLRGLQFTILGSVQGEPLSGTIAYQQVHLAKAEGVLPDSRGEMSENPWWVHCNQAGCTVIPHGQPFGEGVLLASPFQNSGVHVGDSGYLTYYTQTTGTPQEQRMPVYVAGFYDPKITPFGRKLIFAAPQVVSLLRSNFAIADTFLGNGINVWFPNLTHTDQVKAAIIHAFKTHDLEKYWNVESYKDYEFVRPILQQLQSDKYLFSLISFLILLVAGSNVICMLILLVHDKKREIGILQAMGASPRRIALIFGLCGFILGGASAVLGSLLAMFTLQHLQTLIHFLSVMQGHPLLQATFYGDNLPNQLNGAVLGFVIGTTLLTSLLAGAIPAIKATRIRPAEILRAE